MDFYRHRLVVEEEAVRQARQCLEQQARDLQARHAMLASQPSNTIQQLQQVSYVFILTLRLKTFIKLIFIRDALI